MDRDDDHDVQHPYSFYQMMCVLGSTFMANNKREGTPDRRLWQITRILHIELVCCSGGGLPNKNIKDGGARRELWKDPPRGVKILFVWAEV